MALGYDSPRSPRSLHVYRYSEELGRRDKADRLDMVYSTFLLSGDEREH
jgi:hypothetical protein